MKGEKLTGAEKWFNMAVKKEQEGNEEMTKKCLDKALQLEKEGVAAGESWD